MSDRDQQRERPSLKKNPSIDWKLQSQILYGKCIIQAKSSKNDCCNNLKVDKYSYTLKVSFFHFLILKTEAK